MEAKLLKQGDLPRLLDVLTRDYVVIAPKDELSYGEIHSASEFYAGDDKPRKSLKEFFFPPREVLLEYTVSKGTATMTPATAPTGQRVAFCRPCDAAALPILDKVFTWDYLDGSYLQRRQNTIVITMACDEPCEACFCVSLGGSPAGTDGADLQFSPLGDVYHVMIITERGAKLVERYESLFFASDTAHDRERAQREEAWQHNVGKHVDIEGLAEQLDFENPVWQTVTEQCIDCGICTFLCPTCHCFDIQDEGRPEAGERVRLWDSCAFRLFTKTAVHEPRPSHASRYRQRIMHKFSYYPCNFGRTLCVGCGRCIQYCPVGIDITAVLETVKE